jgi:hypothetical protein
MKCHLTDLAPSAMAIGTTNGHVLKEYGLYNIDELNLL